MPLKCLIADDEPGSHLVLKRYLSELPFAEFAGSCYNALEVYQFLKTEQVDILLLDINMPEIDVFALLDMLPSSPAVIITTAYSDYALKSYEYDAVDYLHKPIRLERLIKALEKVSRRLDKKSKSVHLSKLELRIDGAIQEIDLEDIIYIESMGNYVKLVCEKKILVTALTTKELEHRLPAPQFIRIHKSFIVNTQYITEVKAGQVFTAQKTLPLGKTFKKYLELFYKEKGN